MSVVILYRGQRKAFKCGSAPMKSIVDDAVTHFKIKASVEFNLMHKNRKVDLSTPFLMSSIPNNALLELVCSDKKDAKGAGAETRLAISCDSGFGNLSGTFRSDSTLLEVLACFVEQGALPAPLLDPGLRFSPPLELIYLRQRFLGLEALRACSLASLGLGGSSARLQLRVPTAVLDAPSSPTLPAPPPAAALAAAAPAPAAAAVVTTEDPSGTATTTTVSLEERDLQVSAEKDFPALNRVFVETKGESQEVLCAPPLQVLLPPSEQRSEDAGQAMGEVSPPVMPDRLSSQPATATEPDFCAASRASITPAAVHAAVTAVLNANFDAASKKAIITTLKFLDNLIKFPDSQEEQQGAEDAAALAKYRSINLANPIVREQILSCQQGLELLLALGFVVKRGSDAPAVLDFSSGVQRAPERLVFGYARVRQDWQLSPHTTAGYTVQSTCAALQQGEVGVSALLAVRDVLCAALAELDLSSSPSSSSSPAKLASTLALLQSIARRQAPLVSPAAPAAPVVQFDPYKPFIMRAGADKVVVKASPSAGGSSTAAKLHQLNKRRRELEGDRSSVQRMTRVSMKGAHTFDMMAAQKEAAIEDQSSEETDGQIQARALKQAMLRLGAQGDDGPALTTRAVKELERAQKALVYSQTLIKVCLPDKVCLQAYFHPRDTVEDIAQWLRAECFAEDSRMDTGGAAVPLHDFDLYTSPPRRSLFAPQLAPAGQPEAASLLDLSLVPAAVVHLAWQGASALQLASANSSPGHTYLSPPLLAELLGDRGDAQLAARPSSSSIPSGQRLVPESSKDSSQQQAGEKAAVGSSSARGGRQESTGDTGTSSSSSNGSSGGGKPKWFKL